MKAAPVPGAVDLCVTTLRVYGTKSLTDVIAPTLDILDAGGRDWYGPLAVTLRKLVEAEQTTRGTREEKLVAARDRFYNGDIADELEAWYIQTGALLRKGDLAAHVTSIEEPVSIQYRGYTVYKCSTWTQGPALCQALRILEGYDLGAMGHLSADYIHVVTEALKLAFADRDQYYGDPGFVDVPLDVLLSDAYTKERRAFIRMDRASTPPRGALSGGSARTRQPGAANSGGKIPVQDTTTCVVADRWGNVVAATPSCNLLTNTPGPSGVAQGNRVRCLNTAPDHPNRLQPGKRPRITLTPTLVTKNGKPVAAISVAGGDLQDQTTLNVLLNHVDFGMLPADAVTAPRFSTGHHENSFDPRPDRARALVAALSLQMSEAIAGQVRDDLSSRGHQVTSTSKNIADPVMIYIDHMTGTIYAAGDPAANRHGAAID
jgi:gamma-glutamyltranspeptidase/glutathione hydrolase